ncbi:AAA domain-containing protein [Prevotella sp. E9-3]|uniref:AAA domain-containing protein n=1 Tax=Prevotella sp. E9-3 TaxID=2913621 RepID=UPI001EDC544C|nr:AAA domain-containing protein [Prevotella sp. E9-3]UKK48372.1 AAA domain-containing protein [Prevotella sp. E9-3]
MPSSSPILELQHQQLLLQMEYEEEKKAFQQKVDAIGLQRRIQRGDAWWPIRVGRSYYNSLNQLCVEVFRATNSDEDIEHNFEYGRPVSFFRIDNSKLTADNYSQGEKNVGKTNHTSQLSPLSSKFSGSVSFCDGDRMVVVVPDNFPVGNLQQEGIGIQLSFDETSYRMMFDALERTMRAKGRLGYLRDLFYSPSMKAETFSFPDMHFPYLNVTQEQAVNKVLRAKDVAIVHGPPGTGKTTTLVEAIYETLRRESQVLVCAQSNMAVDWISEKLVDRGLNVLRIGNPVRVDDKMLSFTYERRFEAHPDYELLWSIRKTIRELRKNRKRGDEKFHQKLERLKERATALEIAINQELFGEARVIACTLVGSGHRLLDGMKFGTLFIDEAAQALEAACWIPIRRASRVIFAGDHCQLPPTVKSYEALKGGLGKTLMERIVDQKPDVVTLLTLQYRMNEEIMRFSSDWFYDNMVESAPEVKYRSILDLDLPMTWIETSAFLTENSELGTERYDHLPDSKTNHTSQFLDKSSGKAEGSTPDSHFSSEEFVGESFGRVNKVEARLTLLALQAYYEMIGKERILSERLDVGIISPYRAQVQLLRKMIKKSEFFKPFRSLITVNTIDGFQGQERDIIVVSLVRSNDEGQIGFLRDLRRMNVAITRARMKLIILGDRHTLCRHPFYRKLWEYIQGLRGEN